MSQALAAEGVGKRYKAMVALDDLTFGVAPGEIVGVLGPNGAGKTTAIRVLTTILEPSRGSFSVAGIPSARPAAIRARIGVLPESAGFPAGQTGEEFLRLHARLHGLGRADARTRADALLAEVGLHDRRRSAIGSYSRGMRQRLGIARALVNAPDVVFLDEPTLGLDPAGQRQVLDLVRLIVRERGATVLLSTHLLAEVEEVCSRVLILNRGRVVADGTVAEITSRAAAPRTARLAVAPENAGRAEAALRDAPGVGSVAPLVDGVGAAGAFALTLEGRDPTAVNSVLRALVDADVPLLSFDLDRPRLSDAFLAMTEEA